MHSDEGTLLARGASLLLSVLLLVVPLVLTQLALLGARMDGGACGASWGTLLIPTWALDGLALGVGVCVLGGSDTGVLSHARTLLHFCLIVLAQARAQHSARRTAHARA